MVTLNFTHDALLHNDSLIQKLHSIVPGTKLIHLFSSQLTKHNRYVKHNKAAFALLEVNRGIVQFSTIGSLLSIILAYDLPEQLTDVISFEILMIWNQSVRGFLKV